MMIARPKSVRRESTTFRSIRTLRCSMPRLLLLILFGSWAPLALGAQSTCISSTEYNGLPQKVLARVQKLTAPMNASDESTRVAYGYPLVPAAQVTLVTQAATCTKAYATFKSSTTGGAGYTGRVIVVKAGTTYTVVDPGYYWNAASRALHLVLMDSKYKRINLIQG